MTPIIEHTQKKIKLITTDTTLVWLRRDLRLNDNAALYFALKENKNVIPLFIFDTCILDELEDRYDQRVEFIHQSLIQLQQELIKLKTSILVLYGNPIELYQKITPKAVYTNNDYEPYARKRDESISENLKQRNIAFRSFKDHVIFEKGEILKNDGTPYTVFTPYMQKWKTKYMLGFEKSYSCERFFKNFKPLTDISIPSLENIGFKKTKTFFPLRIIKQKTIKQYTDLRNYPAKQGTTQLSVHLRFGTVSIRKLASIGVQKSEAWLNELIWRDFYHYILWHFPYVETGAFKPVYNTIAWRNNEEEYKRWCEGNTGYPIVDAGMRELNTTGFMHNRVRMITASFLTKHLLIDWRWGEAYFAKKLLDYDLAANNGGWQWAAGCGCDAAPYFRVFNPEIQTKKFDPNLEYIKKWIPEYGTATYPCKIVEHTFARKRVLKVYADAVMKNN